MQIKSRELLAFFFGEYFCKLLIFKKLYAAVGLLLLACVLLFSVNSIIQEKNKQHNMVLQSENQTAGTPVTSNVPPVSAEEPAAPMNETAKWPVKGEITMAFGWQEHPLYKDWRYHTGIDIAVGQQQDVCAVYSGTVTDIFIDKHYGLTAVIKGKDYNILYSSLSVADAHKGSLIKAGQSIGKTGICRDEPIEHLHMAVKKGDRYIDPASLF